MGSAYTPREHVKSPLPDVRQESLGVSVVASSGRSGGGSGMTAVARGVVERGQ